MVAVEERRSAPSFPGKPRLAAVREKEIVEGKIFRDAKRLNVLAAPRHRPDRTFGTARNTNVNLQRLAAAPSKTPKQPKPVVVLRKPPQKDASRIVIKPESAGVSGEPAKDAASKPKSETRKLAVRFQGEERAAESKIRKSPIPAEGPLTPKSLIRSALLGTPYYSAKSCSKCRFDKLEYAPYWLSQIKLAESVGKHFASAAFFRLAFECNAEPMRSLKSELKRYLARHSSLANLSAWKEASLDYGLLDGEPNPGLINFDSIVPLEEETKKQKEDLDLGVIPEPDSVSLEESLRDIRKENGDGESSDLGNPLKITDEANDGDAADSLTATSPAEQAINVIDSSPDEISKNSEGSDEVNHEKTADSANRKKDARPGRKITNPLNDARSTAALVKMR